MFVFDENNEYLEGITQPSLMYCECTSHFSYLVRDWKPSDDDVPDTVDIEKVRDFCNVDPEAGMTLSSIMHSIFENYLGKVIAPSLRGVQPFVRAFPLPTEEEGGPPAPKRTQKDIEDYIAAAENKITTDDLADDIRREIELSAYDDNFKDGEVFNVKCGRFAKMIEREPEGWRGFIILIAHILDRHIGTLIDGDPALGRRWPMHFKPR